jgi:hypothetical protein
MRKIFSFSLCLVLTLGVAVLPAVGVAYAQTAINSDSIDQLELMKSKKKDVIALFGQPTKTTKIGNEEILVYQVSKKDPVSGKDTCDLLTIGIGWGDYVTSLTFKKYCEL